MKKIIYLIIGLLTFVYSSTFAADLIDVYCQALKCDPTFNAAYAELLADKERIPISRSLLLPRLDVHAEAERQRIKLEGINFTSIGVGGIFLPIAASQTFYNNSVYYYLKLTQPVFNYTNWAKLQQSKATVRSAEARFCADAQDLMVRVVKAYFDVMVAYADLHYTRENKKAVAEQLRQSREQFKVGVVPITNVYEALAKYDLIVAQEVSDRYEVAKTIESLRQITNHLYCNLKGLNAYLPLIKPEPADINAWVCIAEKQNYELLAARYKALAARQNIKVQSGDHLPVVNTYGEFSYNFDSNIQGSGFYTRQKILEGGVMLDWAPIQGGGITARTNQAFYQYQQACQEQEITHRQVVADARNAYLGIFSGIASVRAYHSSIISGEKSVKATIESYKVGTRTILDVLNQQTQLYNAYKDYARVRYKYIYQTILLKQAAGTLCVEDLQHINCWLYTPIDISMYDALLDGCTSATTH